MEKVTITAGHILYMLFLCLAAVVKVAEDWGMLPTVKAEEVHTCLLGWEQTRENRETLSTDKVYVEKDVNKVEVVENDDEDVVSERKDNTPIPALEELKSRQKMFKCDQCQHVNGRTRGLESHVSKKHVISSLMQQPNDASTYLAPSVTLHSPIRLTCPTT